MELEGYTVLYHVKNQGFGMEMFGMLLISDGDCRCPNYVGLRAVGVGILIFVNINQYLQDFAGTWPCVGLILIREDMAKCILDNLNGGTSKKGELCPPL